MGAGYGVGGQL